MSDGLDCTDCGVDTKEIHEYYMVTPEVWTEATGEPDRTVRGSSAYDDTILCVGCLEERLERQLNPIDFLDCPVNFEGLWVGGLAPRIANNKSDRLWNRMFEVER